MSSSWCSTFPGVLRFREAPCSREWGVRGCLGGASTGSSISSSWCSTFPGSSTFPGVQRYWEGVPGVAWEGRALARPLHRAGARRSQEVLRFREAPCSREWGVRGCLGGTSTGSSASSSWCSTFSGNATRKLDAPRWYRSVKQSEGHAAPDRALGLLLFPLGCADVLGQGAAGILVLLLHLPLHLCLAVHRRRGQCLVQQAGGHGLEPARILLCRLHMVTELAILQARVIGVVGLQGQQGIVGQIIHRQPAVGFHHQRQAVTH